MTKMFFQKGVSTLFRNYQLFLFLTLLFSTTIFSQTIIDVQVSSGNDDAEERLSNGKISRGSSDLEIYNDRSDQEIGIRFQNVSIPQGATITNAYIQFSVDETNESGAIVIGVAGEDIDNSPGFSSASFNISTRTKTSASIENWSPPNWSPVDARGPDQRTPDLAAIVQEIIDRGGWSSNNSMSFILYKPSSVSSTSKNRTARSYNKSASKAPTLHVEFTTVLPQEIDITGNGVSITSGDSTPIISDDTDFGSLDVASGIASHTFTINNTGTADLTLSNPVLTGDISDFIITANPSSLVIPSGSTIFTVEFDPTVIGTRTATISIANNDLDENPYTFTIQGVGVDTSIYPSSISAGDDWSYLDNGSNQGTSWSQLGYDDSSWSSGSAELGYGEGDESTTLSFGADANNKHITYYFRKQLTIADPSIYESIDLEAIRDDGMIVYVNGVLVWSDNMPGVFDHTTFSSAIISGAAETTWITTNIENNLVVGTNVIAVEIHQRDGTSSDLSFDFKLSGVVPATEMDIQGLGVSIANGDSTPSSSDDTNFGSENFNTGLASHTFTIENTGALDLNLTGVNPYVVITGDTSEFSLRSNPSTPIISSGSTTFTIDFDPTSLGIKTATISILNDDSDENPYTFLIQGTGIDNTPIFPSSISSGDTWTYLDNGSNQGTVWSQLGFDDSAWSQGDAELGYGDGGETTVVSYGPSSTNKYITTYFRKELTISDPSIFTSIDLEAIRDDGMVVYLNGVEVWRDNMPTGTISSTTFANGAIGGSDESTFISNNITNSFVVGTNVIGVEIHQSNLTSSDISFDFTLTGVSGTSPEPSSIVAGDLWKYLDDGSNQGTSWTSTAFDDSSWIVGNAEMGYGDGGENTVVSFGPNSSDKYVTTYYRKSFSISDPSVFTSIDLEAIRDDGMVVYLNGSEIWRDHMPTGTISNTTLASSPAIAGTDETTWITNNISSSGLVVGTNVIAVEIHQQSVTSSDTSFDFKLTTSTVPVGATQVVRGPYLQTGTDTSIIVRWRTSVATDTKVNYGTSLASLSASVSDASLTTEHEIQISGLTAGTKYYYNIEDTNGVYLIENNDTFIQTAPTPGDATTFVRAWILGDAGTSGNDTYGDDQEEVRDAYYNYVSTTSQFPNQTDMMLFLGDNAYNSGTDTEYQKGLFDIYDTQLRKTTAWSCIGNHDAGSASSTSQSGVYYDIFSFPKEAEAGGSASSTEAYYSFDYANIHFIVLDSQTTDTTFRNIQETWVTNDIGATTQDWIVAIFHHPPYTKGSHDSDTESQLVYMRENFLPILEAGGVDLIMSGHSHSYERSKFINGRTGSNNNDALNSGQPGAGVTVGVNGNLSGRGDTTDGAYIKTTSDPAGAVYITTGSAGKATSGNVNHAAMYYSVLDIGSTILEIEADGSGGQNMNVKFLSDDNHDYNFAINDHFTINKPGGSSSREAANDVNINDEESFNLYPVPTPDILNVVIKNDEKLMSVNFYNKTGLLVKESKHDKVNVNKMKPGMYVVEIVTDKNKYYQSIIIE